MLNHFYTCLAIALIALCTALVALLPAWVIAIILVASALTSCIENYNDIFTIIETWRGKA